jgi:EAL domain-containing protein (putative c-di-GMP-specific phosphodiesterase class I)/CheY-like chemotaxis protein
MTLQESPGMEPVRRALVVDDDPRICSFLVDLLETFGLAANTTHDVKTADLTPYSAADVIFVDMMMPGTDGIQVLDILARQKVKSAIVLMSGAHKGVLATAETIARHSGLRVIALLNKPFRNEEIRRVLDESQQVPQRPGRRSLSSEANIEDIMAGLSSNEFDAELYPIVDLGTGLPVGYEAIPFWRSEKFRLVPPDRFLSFAARSGILPRMTRQIADRALGYASTLKKRGQVWRLSINLRPEDLLEDQLPERLANLVAGHGLPPRSLTVELTESSAMANEITVLGTLARMRLKGIELAIDDFGSTQSSLDRLIVVPFTSLKIDPRFIAGMTSNRNARLIVESSVALARRLKMEVVAQGIETPEQQSELKKMGCDLGQGTLFARPMEFDALMNWMPQPSKPAARQSSRKSVGRTRR